MASRGFVALLGAVLACRIAAADDSPADAQLHSLALLRESSKVPVELRMKGPIPIFVRAEVPIPKTLPSDPVVQALDFLQRYRAFYRLADPASELYLIRRANGLGEHVFFGQRSGAVPVKDAEIAVHLSGGAVIATSGRWIADLHPPPSPGLTPQRAEMIAATRLGNAQHYFLVLRPARGTEEQLYSISFRHAVAEPAK